MDMKSIEDRRTTTKLLQESIIQLCKVTAGLSGNLVVDGIVCICCDDEPHQIVVKIHERLQLGVPNGFDKTIACDSNRKCGLVNDILLTGAESQGVNTLSQKGVNSNTDGERRSQKKAVGKVEGGKHECGVCFAKFVSKQQLVSHKMKLHCKPMSLYCHACQMAFSDGRSYVRHRYSSCHRTHPRQQRRSSGGRRWLCSRSVQPQFASASSCGNQRKSNTADLTSVSRPTSTPVSIISNASTAGGLSSIKDILPLAAGEYVICINEPDAKLQDDNKIHNSILQHADTQGNVCEGDDSVNDSVMSHERILIPLKLPPSAEMPLQHITKPLHTQEETPGDVSATGCVAVNISSTILAPPAVENTTLDNTDVSTDEQFLCEFCKLNLGTFDRYVCHVEKIHQRYPCHGCSRMYRDACERRSHMHREHHLPAIYCNLCFTDFFDRNTYIAHRRHHHGVRDTQDGGSWYVDKNASRSLDAQSEDRVNFSVSSTQRTHMAANNSQVNDTMQLDTEIKVYDISDEESASAVDDNDRLEQSQAREAVNPPQAPPHPNRTYVCSMCSNVLHGVAAFEQHCMGAHGRYGCMYCEKLFTQKGNMRRHQLTHTGEKPYRCIVCGVAFKRKEQLTTHELVSHNIVVRSQFYTLN
ncbi:hypothetical protein NP493_351g01010 [Ridgeia piscesae]|uniref:C2H2-type domain-containing protein n=1 Tax=Ridgeia piscesae TaxID=27915 RepID=A0AAD9L433_RIDPI|nr:hypothetical protein NP493_351g01010 [Ridgeia piscesae]